MHPRPLARPPAWGLETVGPRRAGRAAGRGRPTRPGTRLCARRRSPSCRTRTGRPSPGRRRYATGSPRGDRLHAVAAEEGQGLPSVPLAAWVPSSVVIGFLTCVSRGRASRAWPRRPDVRSSDAPPGWGSSSDHDGARRQDRTRASEFGPLALTDFMRYADASGDFNPMHHDKDFARSAGYPTVIAHGMLQAALLATYATGLLGAATVHRFGVRFRSQVFYGDTLNCSGTVVAVEEGPRAAWPP
ncbi:MaoC/PaaZ C-terminal domain-containing protein [Streptomyces canus]|uniref:MaoC/PaaZ C-terminal domain-containing protein n=1 Tax=Streptomyces canus TaxID=58343 RepID=UPI002E276400